MLSKMQTSVEVPADLVESGKGHQANPRDCDRKTGSDEAEPLGGRGAGSILNGIVST
jgi:hypothetical protein